MHGCVVHQKLPYLYMCTNACMLAVKACMQVAHVFQEFNLHDVQLALHKKDRNKGGKCFVQITVEMQGTISDSLTKDSAQQCEVQCIHFHTTWTAWTAQFYNNAHYCKIVKQLLLFIYWVSLLFLI